MAKYIQNLSINSLTQVDMSRLLPQELLAIAKRSVIFFKVATTASYIAIIVELVCLIEY